MAEVLILKAVEFDKLSAKFRKKYVSSQALWEAGWLAQCKYDGVFGMAIIDGERSRMLSRTGEVFKSCDHILDNLRALEDMTGPCVFLGELWASGVPQPVISGSARRFAPSPSLRFAVNDLVPLSMQSIMPYAARLTELQTCLPAHDEIGDPLAFVVECIQYSQQWGIMDVAQRLKSEGGYDGAILRDPTALYKPGLVKEGEIVKVKPTLSLDLRVLRVEEGLGKHAGSAGALVVSYRGKESSVGTGLSDTQRKDFWRAWQHDNTFEPRGYEGPIVEIEFLGFTEDGALREPRFKGIRFDKEEQDT